MVFSDVSLWHCSLFFKAQQGSHTYLSIIVVCRQPRAFLPGRHPGIMQRPMWWHLNPVLLFLELRIYWNPLTFVHNFPFPIFFVLWSSIRSPDCFWIKEICSATHFFLLYTLISGLATSLGGKKIRPCSLKSKRVLNGTINSLNKWSSCPGIPAIHYFF